jgi:putative ABC transport system permease protein
VSLIALLGAAETGLIYAFVALGVYLSFRVLQFPDLTVDGSFPLGAAVAAFFAGAAAGLITAWLHVRLNILHLLASILTMIALFSINLRVMGGPVVPLLGEKTIFSPLDGLGIPSYWTVPAVLLVAVILCKIAIDFFLNSQIGAAMRATGSNPRMARAQGINTGGYVLLGIALSNALVAVGGALFAQSQGAADITLGVGTIVVGLAAVIGGEAVILPRTPFLSTLGCIVGSILYRLAVALALNADFIGLKAQDLNLITAVLVAGAMVLPTVRTPVKRALLKARGR